MMLETSNTRRVVMYILQTVSAFVYYINLYKNQVLQYQSDSADKRVILKWVHLGKYMRQRLQERAVSTIFSNGGGL